MDHMTADQIYAKAKELMPAIAMGTVYRNLNLMVQDKQIKKVKIIALSVSLPTSTMVETLKDAPRRIIANFKSFLEVNFKPFATFSEGWRKKLMIIPRNIAITAALIICTGIRLSMPLATKASAKAAATPGINSAYFFILYASPFAVKFTLTTV